MLGLVPGCDDPEPQDAPPTFEEIDERVFQVSCVFSTCHKSGPSPAGMLSLEGDVAHMSLVDVRSSVLADEVLVVPGDPDASYLMEKLGAAMPAAGDSMPPDAALDTERTELVRAWIEAGAADD